MDKITIEPHYKDQQRIRYWGVPCGYCSLHPNMPVCFFVGPMDRLTLEEKADVLEYVIGRVGTVRRTPQTREVFSVLDNRAAAGSQRRDNPQSADA